jgi:predicted GNAT family acetyltransferase
MGCSRPGSGEFSARRLGTEVCCVGDGPGQPREIPVRGIRRRGLAGFTEYHPYLDEIAFIHTETDPAFAGRGSPGYWSRTPLDDVRKRGLAALPYCPYVRRVIVRRPEYLDLVPEEQRERFGLGRTEPT